MSRVWEKCSKFENSFRIEMIISPGDGDGEVELLSDLGDVMS